MKLTSTNAYQILVSTESASTSWTVTSASARQVSGFRPKSVPLKRRAWRDFVCVSFIEYSKLSVECGMFRSVDDVHRVMAAVAECLNFATLVYIPGFHLHILRVGESSRIRINKRVEKCGSLQK